MTSNNRFLLGGFLINTTTTNNNNKMSKSVDDDGFCIVKSKRSAKKFPRKLPEVVKSYEVEIAVGKSIRKILLTQDELRQSEYFSIFIEAVSSCLRRNRAVEIVCFGLGHFAECNIALHQLALLLSLKDVLKAKVLAHDPVFYKKECEILHNLDVIVIDTNEEGKYRISKDGPTVVYLPHCPKQLTNNFLWANWGEDLKHCVLICNSFSRLIESNPDRLVANTVPFIYKLYPFTKEIALENIYKFTDIFNDISIHIFPEDKLKDLPSDFWYKGESPKYEDTTEFITSLVIEKLHL